MKKISGLFIVYIIVLLFPVWGICLDKIQAPLNGTVSQETIPKVDIKKIMNGEYQYELDNYLLSKTPGKSIFIKCRSQLLYSLFNVSSNNNVVIGKEKQLFEPEYLNYNYNIYGQMSKEEVDNLVEKLKILDSMLEAEDKELYIFITPSKARYYKEYAPSYYELCGNDTEELDYDKFKRELETTNINVFDSIVYIDSIKEEFKYPLWYSTGIHWSRVLGSTVAKEFNSYLIEKSKYKLGQIDFSYKVTDVAASPDSDLYDTLNLLRSPNETYYAVKAERKSDGEQPKVFLRGGSFMGQSLSYLISKDIFGDSFHFENNYYFMEKYSKQNVLSNFDAYEEAEEDIKKYIQKSDMVILEVNEEKIWTMSWGFIDYILEHPEWLERE